MEYSECRIGRTFAARLRDGESIYAEIEKLAEKEGVQCASVLAVGGIRRGAVVTGPLNPDQPGNLQPMVQRFDDARELVGVGTLFPQNGKPSLHFHAGMGRGNESLVGCPRERAECFLILEVIIIEWLGLDARRDWDPATGFHLLRIFSGKKEE